MKKKILSLIFAICLILPCAFIFSACDDKPEPIMHTVTFVYDNGTENNISMLDKKKSVVYNIFVNINKRRI